MFNHFSNAPRRNDPYAGLRLPGFRSLMPANFLRSLAQAILSIIVGWELYLRTHSALALRMVGFVQIVPKGEGLLGRRALY